MKILTVCHQGNNRSVSLAHRLKYWGHDVVAVGAITNSKETLTMLYAWADKIILCGALSPIEGHVNKEIVFLEPGPDDYPRPFNPELDTKVKEWMQENKGWLKP